MAPVDATDVHAMVEFVNRTITGLVSVAVILAVLGSLLVDPAVATSPWAGPSGSWPGWIGQIVSAGSPCFPPRPPFVMGHFLLSMVLPLERGGAPPPRRPPRRWPHRAAREPDAAGHEPAARGQRRHRRLHRTVVPLPGRTPAMPRRAAWTPPSATWRGPGTSVVILLGLTSSRSAARRP
jgi:hypothetical protein